MSYQVTQPQLNEFLHDKTYSIPVWYDGVKFACELMLFTGCRAREATDLNRWQESNDNVILLATLKSNNPRSFTISDLPPSFNFWYSHKEEYHKIANYRRCQYVTQQLFGSYTFKAGIKDTLLHLYRYNYAKWLSYNGMDAESIMIRMGHKKIETTEYYINGIITTELPIN